MRELSPGVFRIDPSKITPTKYISYFVVRDEGNLLFPCLSSASTFESDWSDMHELGGVAAQLIGDMHFATKHCDVLADEFGTPVQCSEVEAPDVRRKVKQVLTFPFERHEIANDVTVIPTPGHRPGAISYLVSVNEQKTLFVGDSIWHDGNSWKALASKKNRKVMAQTLENLKQEEFSAMYANVSVKNPVSSIEFSSTKQREQFFDELISEL